MQWSVSEVTSAEQIARLLTVRILRGEFAPGSRLPPVRSLAKTFAVNQATIQRAVARIEATGLVNAHRGSGLNVNDPTLVGGLSLVPAWLEAFSDDPRRAGQVLGDFLQVRRVLAARLLGLHREQIQSKVKDLLVLVGSFTPTGRDIHAVQRMDFAFARALMKETGSTAAHMVLNTAEHILHTVPHVAEAMYAQPARTMGAMRALVVGFAEADSDEAATRLVEDALAEADGRTVRSYRARLRRSLS